KRSGAAPVSSAAGRSAASAMAMRASSFTACPRRSQQPPRSGARRATQDLAALGRADHRLGEVVERDIFGEEAVEHRADEEGAAAFEGLLVERDRDLEPARGTGAGALAQPPHNRPAGQRADAAQLALGGAVGEIREERQDLAQRLGILAGAVADEAEVVEAEHVD